MEINDVDINFLQTRLNKNAKKYLDIIFNEYGQYFSEDSVKIFEQLKDSTIVKVDKNFNKYFQHQRNEILSDSSLSNDEKAEKLHEISTCLAHGARVYNDNMIHVYPMYLLESSQSKSSEDIFNSCDSILVHEILHYFIRPNYEKTDKKGSFLTEGLVDMCTRDIEQKYGIHASDYSSNYTDNVIFVRDALENVAIPDERTKIVFNDDMNTFFKKTTTDSFDSEKEATKIVDFQQEKDPTKKQELMPQYRKRMLLLTSLFSDYPASPDSILNALMNKSANYKSSKEAFLQANQFSLNVRMDLDGLTQEQKNEVINRGILSPLDSAYSNYKKEINNLNSRDGLTNQNVKVKKLEMKPEANHSSGFVNNFILIICVILMIVIVFSYVYYFVM